MSSAVPFVSLSLEKKWPDALPEVAVPAGESEELRQLRARQMQGDAGLESDHDRFGHEARDRPASDKVGEQRQSCDN